MPAPATSAVSVPAVLQLRGCLRYGCREYATVDDVRIHGECAARFAGVRAAFARNFANGEVGAALAVTLGGEPVVDLWGGWADGARARPWKRDTLVNVYSTTKGMTALCANRLLEEGRLDLDAPVAAYWPEFAQAGKERLPVRYLLTHQAGLAALTGRASAEKLYDWTYMTAALAAQAPWWEPGTQHGYHAITFGHLVGELVRRVDGRTLGTYFRQEVAEPLGIDFHIGLAAHEDGRCADILPPAPAPRGSDSATALTGALSPLGARALGNPLVRPADVNTRAWRGAEIPAANGHGTARALARVYGALACGGSVDGVRVLGADALARATTEYAFGTDAVLAPLQTRFGLGFFLTHPMIPFGPNPRAFGHPGAGGSVAFADPDARIGFAYVMNQMQTALAGDARGFALIFEVYEALR